MYDEDKDGMSGFNKNVPDHERKVRREIANSNERRRMQSINAGFQSLKNLLPQHEGEKMSKASILQQTAEYIYTLEQEKTRLLSQNCQLKRLLALSQQRLEKLDGPSIKKAKINSESNESLFIYDDDGPVSTIDAETSLQLLQERQLRIQLEAKLHSLETELVSAKKCSKLTSGFVLKDESAEAGTTTFVLKERNSASSAPIHQTVYLKSNPEVRLQQAFKVTNPDKKIIQSVEIEAPSSPEIVNIERPPNVIETDEPSESIVTTDPHGHRSYIVTTNNSRQNLDSIVEAIRHLEGDHLFSSEDQNVSQVMKEEVVMENLTSEALDGKNSFEESQRSPTIALPNVSPNNIIILKQSH